MKEMREAAPALGWHISVPLCELNVSDFSLIFIIPYFRVQTTALCCENKRVCDFHSESEFGFQTNKLSGVCCGWLVAAVKDGCGAASASLWSQGGSIDTVVWALQQAAQQQTNCLWCNWGLGPLREAYISLYVEMFKEQWISISGCKIVFGASAACSQLSKQWQKGLFQDGTCNSEALTGGRRNGM